MTIQEFADRYKLKIRRDGCGDPLIRGNRKASDMPPRPEYFNHIYDHGDGQHLGVCLLAGRALKAAWDRKAMVAAGFVLRQKAHSESTALFDPANRAQARLAIKLVGAHKKRKVAPPTLAQKAARERFSVGRKASVLV